MSLLEVIGLMGAVGGTVLSAVTFSELAGLVRQEIEGGYESEKQDGRRRLLAVVDELASSDSNDVDDLLVGRTWRIADVRINGLGGIASLDPSPLAFAPSCGVTVVRGPNGHGKTSLARGIDCGLRGEWDVSDEVVGELWTAALLTEGKDTATVELMLVSGGDRLTLGVVFARSEPPVVTATLIDGVGTRAVTVGDAWRRSLLGARACYSYGALQSRLTENRALQGYLEELLVLGPAWEQVRVEITARGDRATRARKAVDAARQAAVRDEQALAAQFGTDDRAPARLASIAWPRANDTVDIDMWLRDTGLGTVTRTEPIRVDADHEDRIVRLDRMLRDADMSLVPAEEALDAPGTVAALHHIEQIVAVDDLDGGMCPVCGTATDWRIHARQIIGSLQSRRAAADEVRRAVSALASWVESALVPLLAAGLTGGPDVEVTAFRNAAADGHHAHSRAHERARLLLDTLASDEYRAWLGRLRATSDATEEWRAALAAVVHRFVGVLREDGPAAAEAGVWKKAQETLDELQLGFRQQRQDAVTEELHAALRRMLPDAEIELAGITHQGGVKQQRGVAVGLTIGGREATLGMLSSGQRNALLLTPLVTLDNTGPFGFLIVDDPVHALDDMRVDLLAQELARLGRHRQVIVLTHDPRLEEHLRARVPDMTVVELHRDPQTRAVTWATHTTPWSALLDDARGICKGGTSDGWAYSEPMASVVAGLCRAAVDGALRQAVISRAVQHGEDVEDALASLGEGRETRKRIAHVIGLAGRAGRLRCLEHGRDKHLTFWNKGSHGQLPRGVDLEATIDAAARACAELTAHDWSVP